jgi:acyl-CoA thioesterase-1
MQVPAISKTVLFLLVFVCLLLLFVLVEVLFVKYNGTLVAVPDIPRTPQQFGEGPVIRYAVMGDSTAVGQGGAYEEGIAMATGRHLAKQGAVTMHNYAISGARMHDVRTKQLPQALERRPDVVLISAGANDVTHLTALDSISSDMRQIIAQLRASNPDMRIVITGSPAMGSVPRFPQPIKYFAGVRTKQVNTDLRATAAEKQVTFAPIAEKTGPIFLQNPQLFAKDKFHPTTEGYKTWIPVLNDALDATI